MSGDEFHPLNKFGSNPRWGNAVFLGIVFLMKYDLPLSGVKTLIELFSTKVTLKLRHL